MTIQREELMMKNTKLSILLSKRDVTAPIPDDLAEWLDSPSVGNEIITDCEDTPLSSLSLSLAILPAHSGLPVLLLG